MLGIIKKCMHDTFPIFMEFTEIVCTNDLPDSLYEILMQKFCSNEVPEHEWQKHHAWLIIKEDLLQKYNENERLRALLNSIHHPMDVSKDIYERLLLYCNSKDYTPDDQPEKESAAEDDDFHPMRNLLWHEEPGDGSGDEGDTSGYFSDFGNSFSHSVLDKVANFKKRDAVNFSDFKKSSAFQQSPCKSPDNIMDGKLFVPKNDADDFIGRWQREHDVNVDDEGTQELPNHRDKRSLSVFFEAFEYMNYIVYWEEKNNFALKFGERRAMFDAFKTFLQGKVLNSNDQLDTYIQTFIKASPLHVEACTHFFYFNGNCCNYRGKIKETTYGSLKDLMYRAFFYKSLKKDFESSRRSDSPKRKRSESESHYLNIELHNGKFVSAV